MLTLHDPCDAPLQNGFRMPLDPTNLESREIITIKGNPSHLMLRVMMAMMMMMGRGSKVMKRVKKSCHLKMEVIMQTTPTIRVTQRRVQREVQAELKRMEKRKKMTRRKMVKIKMTMMMMTMTTRMVVKRMRKKRMKKKRRKTRKTRKRLFNLPKRGRSKLGV